MPSKITILLRCCLGIGLFGSVSATNVAVALAANVELEQLLRTIHTMQASFKQVTCAQAGKRCGEATLGQMSLVRPGKFRWEVTAPHKQLIIINKGQSWLYDPELAQVTKNRVDYASSNNPAVLLSSTTATLRNLFTIEKVSDSGQGCWFVLKPHHKTNATSGYKAIKLGFIKKRLALIYLINELEQQIEIRFYNIKLNTKIAHAQFEFTPPPHVDLFVQS